MSWDQLSDEGVKAIAVDPLHPDTVYYGGQNLMRSYDGGITAEDIRHNVIGTIVDIAVHPRDTNIIFAESMYYTLRLYKSEDRGDSWQLVLIDGGIIVFDPTYPDTIYYGEHRSLDCGETWEDFIGTVPGGGIVAVHPFNSNILYLYNGFNIFISI